MPCSSASRRPNVICRRMGMLTGFPNLSVVTPALNASKRPEPMFFMKYSAKMLLLAFQVRRNSILNFCARILDNVVERDDRQIKSMLGFKAF